MFRSNGSRRLTQSPLFPTRSVDLVCALLAVLLGIALPYQSAVPALPLLLLTLLTIHFYLLKVRLAERIPVVNFTLVSIVAASLLLPPVFTPLMVLAAVLVVETSRRSPLNRLAPTVLHEIAEYGLPAIVMAGVYRLLGGRLPLTALDGRQAVRLGTAFLTYSLTYGLLHFLRRAPFRPRSIIRAGVVQWMLLVLAVLVVVYHFTIKEPSFFVPFILLIGTAMWLIQSIALAQFAMSRHLQELTSLNRIGQAMTANLSLDDLLFTIYAQVQTLCRASTFYIAFFDKDQVSFPFVMQNQQPRVWPTRPAGCGLPEYVIRTRQTLALLDHMDEQLNALGLEPSGEEMTCYLGVPLILGDDVLGVMAIQPDHCADSRIQSNQELFATVAAQAAIAIRNARLFQETEAVTSELYHLVETSRQFTASLDLNQVAETIMHGMKSLIAIEHGALCLRHNNTFQLLAYASEPSARLTEYLITSQPSALTQAIADHTAQTLTLHDPETDQQRPALLLPLVVHDQGIGLAVLWDQPTLSDHERHLLDGMLNQAATALQNALIFSQIDQTLQERVIALSAIEVISRRMSATLDLHTIINDVLAAAMSATDASAGCCALLSSTNQLEIVAQLDAQGGYLKVPYNISPEQGIIGRVLRTGQVAIIPDVSKDPDYIPTSSSIHSELCVPIRREARIIGVLNLEDRHPNAFNEADARFIGTLAEHAAIAIENARLYEEVRTGRDQLQAILDSTHEGMLLFDSRGRLLRGNAAAEAMLGQNLRPFLGESFLRWLRASGSARFKRMTGHTLPQLNQYIRDILRDPSHLTTRQFEQQKGEDIHYLAETGLPVLDPQGRTIGWLLVWRDVTEERKLSILREELSSMIVHDLRSPLTSILSSLTMLEDFLAEGETDPAAFSEVIRVAQNSGENMLSLVQSLLDIARLEQQTVILEYAGHSLSEAVDYACGTMLTLAAGADIALDIQVSDDLPPVLIDAEKIQRVFINLLDNALRFTPYGGKITISAQVSENENRMLVCVADTGPGIPPEARNDIFSKFVQSKRKVVRGHKGTGLGLTFCKLAIEAHGGHIWAEEAPGGGAAFYFTLPIASPESNDK